MEIYFSLIGEGLKEYCPIFDAHAPDHFADRAVHMFHIIVFIFRRREGERTDQARPMDRVRHIGIDQKIGIRLPILHQISGAKYLPMVFDIFLRYDTLGCRCVHRLMIGRLYFGFIFGTRKFQSSCTRQPA